MKRMALIVLGLCAFLAWAPHANATIWTLTDLNSTYRVDDASSAGAFDWLVDGQEQLHQQWFWYRIGATGGEADISTISAAASVLSGTNRLTSTYAAAGGLSVEIEYTLLGGTAGSGTSDVAESIRLINNGTTAMDLHFFQYSDFDLGGDAAGDAVRFPDARSVVQSDGGSALSETIALPTPSHHEGNFFPTTLSSLSDGAPTTLNDLPAIGAGSVGVGDVTWAYQWDFTILAGGSRLISKDKLITGVVPEPGSLMLLGSALVGLAAARSRRRKRS